MKNKYFRDILISLTSSVIFLIIFEPLIKILGNAVFQISNKIFKSFNNSLYISIGQERYDIDICIAL
ncbi:MAG: hypothetical protein II837_11315, partial [Treponema sp.]|nr:hypothetical protein [Treponema sp.]